MITFSTVKVCNINVYRFFSSPTSQAKFGFSRSKSWSRIASERTPIDPPNGRTLSLPKKCFESVEHSLQRQATQCSDLAVILLDLALTTGCYRPGFMSGGEAAIDPWLKPGQFLPTSSPGSVLVCRAHQPVHQQ